MQNTSQSPPTGSPNASDKPTEYFDIPFEIRQMIIDHMDPKTKCRLSLVSHSCRQDLEASKSWVHRLSYQSIQRMASIDVYHKDPTVNREMKHSYQLKFEKGMQTNYLKLFSRNGRLLWTDEFDNSVNIIQRASTKFKELLGKFRNSVQELFIDGWESGSLKFQIENLTNIKELGISNCDNLEDFFVDFRRPLEDLSVISIPSGQDITEFPHIYQVRNSLTLYDVNFEIAKFRRLSAANVEIPIGTIKENEIFQVFEEWKNSNWPSHPESYAFDISDSNFNLFVMLELFDIDVGENWSGNRSAFVIHHNFDARKETRCIFDRSKVVFDMIP